MNLFENLLLGDVQEVPEPFLLSVASLRSVGARDGLIGHPGIIPPQDRKPAALSDLAGSDLLG